MVCPIFCLGLLGLLQVSWLQGFWARWWYCLTGLLIAIFIGIAVIVNTDALRW